MLKAHIGEPGTLEYEKEVGFNFNLNETSQLVLNENNKYDGWSKEAIVFREDCNGILYCYTGDFYRWNTNEQRLRRSNTSLYKATKQLFCGIEDYTKWKKETKQQPTTMENQTLIPIIVTNMDIFVVRQTKRRITGKRTTMLTKVKGAVLENTYCFQKLCVKDRNPKHPYRHVMFPYYWVVHVDALDEFLENPFAFKKDSQNDWEEPSDMQS